MSSFSVDRKNDKVYMVYQADVTEVIDGYTLGIILNSPLTGVVETSFFNDEKGRKFTYNITGMITLKELFNKGIDEKIYVCLLASVTTTLQNCEQYGLNIGNLILNEELIYYDESKKNINFICIPTSGFVSSITSKQVIEEFSGVLINNMRVTNNNILEIHNFLANNKQFDLSDFGYRLNQYMLINGIKMSEDEQKSVYDKVDKTKKPEEKASEEKNHLGENLNENFMYEEIECKENNENLEKEIQEANEAKIHRVGQMEEVLPKNKMMVNTEIIKNKFSDITKTIGNIKNLGVIKEIKEKLVNVSEKKNKDIRDKEEYEQEIKQMVSEQKDSDRKQQELKKEKFDNNQLFDSVSSEDIAYGLIGTMGETIMEDCITGETVDKNYVSSVEPYLLRVSTGEKIIIDQSIFKLGRSKKFVDYYVGGNDTISKVHAYITSKANQYFLVDNSSRNHTFLDGNVLEPIEQMRLKHKSKIRLAKEEFVFYMY